MGDLQDPIEDGGTYHTSVLFKVIFYFPNRKSTIWGIYSEYVLFFWDPLSKSKIHKAYVLGLNLREYPHKIWPNIWYVYVPP